MTALRVAFGAGGLGALAYGIVRLLALGPANLGATAEWLVAGVVLHDALFAPLVVVVGVLAARLAPRRLRAPATVALVVLVPVTLVGLPELGRFGADPRNATLLDRHYWLGWSVLVTLVVVVVTAGALGGRVRERPTTRLETGEGGSDGTRDGRR